MEMTETFSKLSDTTSKRIIFFSSNLAVHILRTSQYKAEGVFAAGITSETLVLSSGRGVLQLR